MGLSNWGRQRTALPRSEKPPAEVIWSPPPNIRGVSWPSQPWVIFIILVFDEEWQHWALHEKYLNFKERFQNLYMFLIGCKDFFLLIFIYSSYLMFPSIWCECIKIIFDCLLNFLFDLLKNTTLGQPGCSFWKKKNPRLVFLLNIF